MIELAAGAFNRGSFTLDVGALRILDGEKVAVLGENGCGKSTLLHILTGLIKTNRVRYDGTPLESLSPRARARRTAFLPQAASVAFPFSVREVVRMGAFAGSGADADTVLARFDIAHLAERSFHELSGGERRRVMLARVFVQDAPHVVLDEPASMLDIRHTIDMYAHLAASEKTVVAAVHDIQLSLRFFDRCIFITHGRLAGDVPRSEVTEGLISEVFGVAVDRIGDTVIVRPERSGV